MLTGTVCRVVGECSAAKPSARTPDNGGRWVSLGLGKINKGGEYLSMLIEKLIFFKKC